MDKQKPQEEHAQGITWDDSLLRRGGKGKGQRSEDPDPAEVAPDLAATDAAYDRARAGDLAAWEELLVLLARFRKGLVALLQAWSRVPYHDAQDAVGDLFLLLVRQARAGAIRKHKFGWWIGLYRMARRLWQRNRHRECSFTKAFHAEPSLGRAEAREELAVLVRKAAVRLTATERKVLFARAQGLSYRQVADILCSSVGAARVHCSNAIRKLRKAS